MNEPKNIKRTEYKKFVEAHILRPYQSDVFPDKKAIHFTNGIYNILPLLIKNNPEWVRKVFSRMEECFDSVEVEFFPEGDSRNMIIMCMDNAGIKIKW